MKALVTRALEVLGNPEHYDDAAAISFFLEFDRGLYVVDLKNTTNGVVVLTVAKNFLAGAKILLDGWKQECMDNETGSMMVAFDSIKKMGEVLSQFNDYVHALDTGEEATLKASNLRASMLHIMSMMRSMYHVDMVKLPDALKFAFIASEAAVSRGFHMIDDIIDHAAGRA